jgi:hypothetical protein
VVVLVGAERKRDRERDEDFWRVYRSTHTLTQYDDFRRKRRCAYTPRFPKILETSAAAAATATALDRSLS